MNIDEIKSLNKRGFTIGAHSMNHPLFSTIDKETQIDEIKNSIDWVKENVSNKPASFAFPFSDDGVQKEALFKIFNQTNTDIGFGTSGIGFNDNLNYYQRIPMEHTKSFNANDIIRSELLAYKIKSVIRR